MGKSVKMTPEEAMQAMRDGDVPASLVVEGDLTFNQQAKEPPRALPDELEADTIIINDAALLPRWPRVVRCRELSLYDLQVAPPADVVFEIEQAIRIVRCGQLTALTGLRFLKRVALDIRACPALASLPADLNVSGLTIEDCPALRALPEQLAADVLSVDNCPNLTQLPARLHVQTLHLTNCLALASLPVDTRVGDTLEVINCPNLTALPDPLDALTISVSRCVSLRALPRLPSALYLTMNGCVGVERWDDPDLHTLRQISARGCHALRALPQNLWQADELDLSGCEALTALPPGLRVTRWLDIGNTLIRALPPATHGVQLRWNGVNVPAQVAFYPETLTARQIAREPNAELRRVMMERMGTARFVAEARPQTLDADTDAGGPRQLVRVELEGAEDLVALQVRDPSTGRSYLLRVPPTMETCRQAAAWIAGFDDPDQYHPIMET